MRCESRVWSASGIELIKPRRSLAARPGASFSITNFVTRASVGLPHPNDVTGCRKHPPSAIDISCYHFLSTFCLVVFLVAAHPSGILFLEPSQVILVLCPPKSSAQYLRRTPPTEEIPNLTSICARAWISAQEFVYWSSLHSVRK
ncbi:hypothetical protein AB1N83_006527 [Pleurotus pulmonarius]